MVTTVKSGIKIVNVKICNSYERRQIMSLWFCVLIVRVHLLRKHSIFQEMSSKSNYRFA